MRTEQIAIEGRARLEALIAKKVAESKKPGYAKAVFREWIEEGIAQAEEEIKRGEGNYYTRKALKKNREWLKRN